MNNKKKKIQFSKFNSLCRLCRTYFNYAFKDCINIIRCFNWMTYKYEPVFRNAIIESVIRQFNEITFLAKNECVAFHIEKTNSSFNTFLKFGVCIHLQRSFTHYTWTKRHKIQLFPCCWKISTQVKLDLCSERDGLIWCFKYHTAYRSLFCLHSVNQFLSNVNRFCDSGQLFDILSSTRQ